MQKRTKVPGDVYAMANGCYRLVPGGEPLFFKPTGLATYLLYDAQRQFVSTDREGRRALGRHGVDGGAKRGFSFRSGSTKLTVDGRTSFRPHVTTGCAAYPESQIDVTGRPTAGVTPYQEVRGYVDAHTHGMAFEFLGGDAHCGRPWHEYGAPYALVDCPDHSLTGGFGGALESVLSGRPHHDPVGWPTFKDWPAPDSLTHEGTYYRWLERSWRGGQRLFVNLLVENNKLCELYPLKRNSCDDMDSIRLQAKDMYAMQDYIDAQFGGPGKGFYRIVRSPFEARKVINAGKMAVVMGIETSVPFGCTMKLDVPACDVASIDRQLDEVQEARRAPDGAGQQVRQRALRRRRRQRRGRGGGQRRELPGDRVLLGHAALRPRRRRVPRPRPAGDADHQRGAAGRSLRGDRLARAADDRAAAVPAAAPLQLPRPDHAGRGDRSPGSRSGT